MGEGYSWPLGRGVKDLQTFLGSGNVTVPKYSAGTEDGSYHQKPLQLCVPLSSKASLLHSYPKAMKMHTHASLQRDTLLKSVEQQNWLLQHTGIQEMDNLTLELFRAQWKEFGKSLYWVSLQWGLQDSLTLEHRCEILSCPYWWQVRQFKATAML